MKRNRFNEYDSQRLTSDNTQDVLDLLAVKVIIGLDVANYIWAST